MHPTFLRLCRLASSGLLSGTTEMPGADIALISGDLGFRGHTGAHIQAPDWPSFIEFARKYLHAPAAK